MTDRLLAAFNRELDALRGLAGVFAERHPKIAGRLRLTGNSVDDPHVERLLEGVAFLSARAQSRLDDEFPEITDALLGVLYPHYLAPVPSAAIAQFSGKADLRVPVTVPAGTPLETDAIEGEPCRFRTAYDTTLWPLAIEGVRLSGLPLAAPTRISTQTARSSLRAVLRLLNPEASFAELGVGELRCYLQGPPEQTTLLYELLCGHIVGVALADGPNDDRPTILPPSSVQAVGFAPEQALYPWPARSFSGFRLLSEYFALPEKFLFVDIKGLDARTMVQAGDRLELFLCFDRSIPELERRLQPDCLALGCTPVVNLFPQQCEPIRLDHLRTEYPVCPDHRRRSSLEVWSVDAVREVGHDGLSRPWRPFYRHSAAAPAGEAAGSYTVIRRDAVDVVGGTDVLLGTFVPDHSVDAPAGTVLSVDALCTNRDLPARLPFGGGQPRLRLSEGISAVTAVTCLTAPTRTLRAPLREQHNWRLVSHLSIGQLSIVGGAEAAEAMREVLRLYDLRDTCDTRAAIAGLVDVRSRDATARVPGARTGSFCRGIDVSLEFDPAAWNSSGLFLLASVLDRFLALHATVNSFVRTTATLRGQSGSAMRFPPRAGARALL